MEAAPSPYLNEGPDSQIYWEKQYFDRLCGLHAINSLLQGHYADEVLLSEIALEIHKKEKKIYKEAGLESEEFLVFMAVNFWFLLILG
jgi:Ataxin-3